MGFPWLNKGKIKAEDKSITIMYLNTGVTFL